MSSKPQIPGMNSVCVNLYWGGKIVQGLTGIDYEPAISDGFVMLDGIVSYDELVDMICERIGINMNKNKVVIVWRRAIFLGKGYHHIGTRLSEQCMELMFREAIEARNIVLFIEVEKDEQPQALPTMVHDVGTSERDIGEQLGADENIEVLVQDSDYESGAELSDREEDLSDASSDDNVSDDEVIAKPKPAPHYGREYVRFLKDEEGKSYYTRKYGCNEDLSYWDENNPTHIGLGTKFPTKLYLKTAIALWHLSAMRQYTVVESKSKRWHAMCKFPYGAKGHETSVACMWEILATTRKHDGHWVIRTWKNGHTCMGHYNSRECANLSSSMVALCVRDQIENDVHYNPSAIMKDVNDKYHVEISYKKAWHAHKKAIELVFGGWESSFQDLPSYMQEMQKANPGTVVEWLHDERLSRGTTKVFKYVFWAFRPALSAFQLCKPVLTIDGTQLRGRHKGKLLIAVGFDSNKKCLPVAFAIVDDETSESWNWFICLIKNHVAVRNRELCIISDRHNGIINAMNSSVWQEAPQGHHRFCLAHVRKNVLQTHQDIKVKILVWAMGIATQKHEYIRRWRELNHVSDEAVRYLEVLEKSKWTLAYDKCRRWGETTTKMVECYNNVLKGARDIPIKACIDRTFWNTVKWFVDRTLEIQNCETVLTPWAHKKLSKNDADAQLHRVKECDLPQGIYEVSSLQPVGGKGENTHTVKYFKGKCTCRKWQIWRLPCSHALAVARDKGDDILELVDKLYSKEVWSQQYNDGFRPLRHEDYWGTPDWTLTCSTSQLIPRPRSRYKRARVRKTDQPRASRHCKESPL
ncbi:uncharacterized protein LOC121784581 [Salvia splendens]|uniref:uncharacterized protein LOC121784581 n=1 Tax=Salvia splendens TaxID=180675 RepID=UPI001C2559C5|nr:uncharacterized protein LOC121784581 [Salvia splendens]XP_042038683.1 uncharacterized protein LOC121784581 [Salvia splendens]XP_042038684.1 uncharacterized protein LOC121784581 [Salvia splendens]